MVTETLIQPTVSIAEMGLAGGEATEGDSGRTKQVLRHRPRGLRNRISQPYRQAHRFVVATARARLRSSPAVAERMQENLGQPIVVEAKPG
jgi:hypothetical protein